MSDAQLALLKAGPDISTTSVTEVPAPAPRAGEVLVEVLGCGICGSDVHAWRGDTGYEWVTTPVVLGHEIAGRVVAHGEGVREPSLGQLVVPLSIDGCGHCDLCAAGRRQVCATRDTLGLSYDGGAAKHMVIRADRTIIVPDGIPARRAALTEPMAVAAHAVALIGEVPRGLPVVVSGPGPIGLLTAWQLARLGHRVIVAGIEPDEEIRLPAARRLGLETVRVDTEALPEQIGAWVEASGSGAGLGDALARVRTGGRIVVVALFGRMPVVDVNLIVRKEITVVGSYAAVRADYHTALEALASADGLEDVIVTPFDLSDAVEALGATAGARVVKAVIEP